MQQKFNTETAKKQTHPSKTSEAGQDFIIQETALSRISQGLVQEVVNEVNARFNGQHHALLEDSGGTQTAQPRQVNALHAL